MLRWVPAFLLLTAFLAHGQKLDSYVDDMREALVPYGVIKSQNCHRVEIELNGPWGNFGIPESVNNERPGELKWAILKINVLRAYFDLAELDEDKISNQAIFSMGYIRSHKKGTPYKADTPAVLFLAKGLNAMMMVHTVDLNKLNESDGQSHITESQMGVTLDERKGIFILFRDQEHADAFEKALRKAIVVCKAQD